MCKPRICLLALIGLPATGKTTFSKWILTLPQKSFNVIHLCFDEYLPQITGDTYTTDSDFEYKNQRKKLIENIETLIEALSNNAELTSNQRSSVLLKASSLHYHYDKRDFLVICDDNNYYRSMRYKLYQICRKYDCAYAQLYFDVPLQLAIQHNSLRPAAQRIPVEILHRMAQRLEIPEPALQHWESITFKFTALPKEDYKSGGLCATLLEFLMKSFDAKPKPLPIEASTQAAQSLLHQLDLLLRKRIGDLLRQATTGVNAAAERTNLAKILNDKRKVILQDVKAEVSDGKRVLLSVDELNAFVNLLQ